MKCRPKSGAAWAAHALPVHCTLQGAWHTPWPAGDHASDACRSRWSLLLSCGGAVCRQAAVLDFSCCGVRLPAGSFRQACFNLPQDCTCDSSAWLQADARAARVEAQLQASQQQAEGRAAEVEAQLHSQQQLLGGSQVQLQEVASRQRAQGDLPQLWATKLEAPEAQLQGQVGCCRWKVPCWQLFSVRGVLLMGECCPRCGKGATCRANSSCCTPEQGCFARLAECLDARLLTGARWVHGRQLCLAPHVFRPGKLLCCICSKGAAALHARPPASWNLQSFGCSAPPPPPPLSVPANRPRPALLVLNDSGCPSQVLGSHKCMAHTVQLAAQPLNPTGKAATMTESYVPTGPSAGQRDGGRHREQGRDQDTGAAAQRSACSRAATVQGRA